VLSMEEKCPPGYYMLTHTLGGRSANLGVGMLAAVFLMRIILEGDCDEVVDTNHVCSDRA
jgi:hypothetical protein